MNGTTSAQIDIEVAGAPLDPMLALKLVRADVDTTMFAPSQFTLVFRDHSGDVIELGGFMIGIPVMLQVTTGGAPTPLMVGDVTGVEVEFGPQGRLAVVKGHDRSHRLMRGTKTMSYPEVFASDVVGLLLGESEVEPGVVEPTTVLYEWLTQPNVSDWTFIQQLAALENRVAFVNAEGMFNFMLPEPEPAPPPPEPMMPLLPGQVAGGENLVRLRASVSAAEQVPTVMVTGWDPTMAMPVVGVAPTTSATAVIVEEPALIAEEVGAKPLCDASFPFDSVETAGLRAESIATDIAGAMAEMEGECIGTPSLRAGNAFSIGLVGAPFDGVYLCSRALHRFDPDNGGYRTWFTVGGLRDRSLLSLTSGNGGSDPIAQGRIPGLVIGTVMDLNDPEELGRVKVQFPWLSDTYVSAWARMVQMGASDAGAGCLWLPEMLDEVLVGFDRGDINHPYVIGNLYNGIKRPIPLPPVDPAVANRRLTSRELHTIQFNDGPEQMGIVIRTGTETVTITLDAEEQALTIVSAGQVSIEAAEAISFKAGGDFSIESGGSFSILSSGGASITSPDVTIAGEASLSMSAAEVSVEGDATVSVTAPEVTLGA